MGLSLQLFVYLSKILEQHSVSSDPGYARHLVSLAQKQAPELLNHSDPGNHHTCIVSAVALGMGLGEAKDNDLRLGLVNALEWTLRKGIPSVAKKDVGSEEAEALAWAEVVLQEQQHILEDGIFEASTWEPRIDTTEETRKISVQVDPMLVSDITRAQARAYAQNHLKKNEVGVTGEGGLLRDRTVFIMESSSTQDTKFTTEASEPSENQDPISEATEPGSEPHAGPAVFKIDDGSGSESKEAALVKPSLIEVTGYESTQPEVIIAHKPRDWGLVIKGLLSVAFPPLTLYFMGSLVFQKEYGKAGLVFAGGIAGCVAWLLLTK